LISIILSVIIWLSVDIVTNKALSRLFYFFGFLVTAVVLFVFLSNNISKYKLLGNRKIYGERKKYLVPFFITVTIVMIVLLMIYYSQAPKPL
jgi:hypothetical protein